MKRFTALVVAAAVAAGCSSSGAPRGGSAPMQGRSAAPGRVPPELTSDVRWLNAPPTTLAALRGKVVYVQFAFPT